MPYKNTAAMAWETATATINFHTAMYSAVEISVAIGVQLGTRESVSAESLEFQPAKLR